MRSRVYILVETEEGERMCWRFRDAELTDSMYPAKAFDNPIEPPHEVEFNGNADWFWRASLAARRSSRCW